MQNVPNILIKIFNEMLIYLILININKLRVLNCYIILDHIEQLVIRPVYTKIQNFMQLEIVHPSKHLKIKLYNV